MGGGARRGRQCWRAQRGDGICQRPVRAGERRGAGGTAGSAAGGSGWGGRGWGRAGGYSGGGGAGALNILSGGGRHTILQEWNATERALPAATLPQLFAAQAAATPDAVAV